MAFHRSPQLIRTFCNRSRFGPPRACSARFSLATARSPGFGSPRRHFAPFRTRVRCGSACAWLSLATSCHSSAHSTKGTPSPGANAGLRLAGSAWVQVCFTPLAGVLFTVPSRYWFAIGRRRYLALGRGRPRFPPDSACRAVLTSERHPLAARVAYGALTRCGGPFQQPSAARSDPDERSVARSPCSVQPRSGIGGRLCRRIGLGSSPFARRYWGNPFCSSRY